MIDRFLAGFAAEKPPFHVVSDITATITSGNEESELLITSEGDVSGEDFAGTVETDFGLGRIEIEVVIVDGVSYTRVGEGPWQANDEFQQTQPLNPFEQLAPEDLEYVGSAMQGGEELHELRTETWIGGEIEAQNIPNSDLELDSSVFQIFVTDAGVPVEARLEFVVVGTSAGQRARLAYVVDYAFSDVGEPVEIEAPPVS